MISATRRWRAVRAACRAVSGFTGLTYGPPESLEIRTKGDGRCYSNEKTRFQSFFSKRCGANTLRHGAEA
jgi:hypothetical protein